MSYQVNTYSWFSKRGKHRVTVEYLGNGRFVYNDALKVLAAVAYAQATKTIRRRWFL